MFGANVKSAHHAADVSQVSLTICLQCVLFQIHNSQFFVVWQRRVSEEVYDGVLLHFLEEEEEPHPVPDHAVLQARPARLQPQHGHHEQVQGEREATLDQTNTTRCVCLYFCPFVLYCYDAIPNRLH